MILLYMYFIIIVILFLLALFVNIEVFESFSISRYLQYGDHTNFPFNNTRLGNTTNMSYDLRGDPLIIPPEEYTWNNPGSYPIYNTSIDNV